jgi:hypothetical protein
MAKCTSNLTVSSILLPLVLTAAVIGTARGDDRFTAGFTPLRLPESKFVVQKPFNVPLDERYDFTDGVRRMWVYSTDKPISTHPGGARTEIYSAH